MRACPECESTSITWRDISVHQGTNPHTRRGVDTIDIPHPTPLPRDFQVSKPVAVAAREWMNASVEIQKRTEGRFPGGYPAPPPPRLLQAMNLGIPVDAVRLSFTQQSGLCHACGSTSTVSSLNDDVSCPGHVWTAAVREFRDHVSRRLQDKSFTLIAERGPIAHAYRWSGIVDQLLRPERPQDKRAAQMHAAMLRSAMHLGAGEPRHAPQPLVEIPTSLAGDGFLRELLDLLDTLPVLEKEPDNDCGCCKVGETSDVVMPRLQALPEVPPVLEQAMAAFEHAVESIRSSDEFQWPFRTLEALDEEDRDATLALIAERERELEELRRSLERS